MLSGHCWLAGGRSAPLRQPGRHLLAQSDTAGDGCGDTRHAGARRNGRCCRVLVHLAGRKKNTPHYHHPPPASILLQGAKKKTLSAVISQLLSRHFMRDLRMKAELFVEVIYSRAFFFFGALGGFWLQKPTLLSLGWRLLCIRTFLKGSGVGV